MKEKVPICMKGLNNTMIAINKAEKEAVVARFPDAHIVRTMVNDSRRHHYYCVEDRKILQFLNKFRKKNVVEVH